MLMNICSHHFISGGTGITNFSPADLPVYEEAIRRFGNPGYVVSQHPMLEFSRVAGLYSLHYIGVPFPHGGEGSSPFWRVFDQVRAESKPPIEIKLTRAQAEALMTVLYCGVAGAGAGRACITEVADLLQAAGIERTRHHDVDTSGRIRFRG